MPPTKTTTQRGYGHRHQKLRLRWKRLLNQQGQLPCTRCPNLVHPTDDWELDHTDDRDSYLGIAHKRCNRSAGGRKSQQPKIQRWQW